MGMTSARREDGAVMVGRYAIYGEIASGGMATVHYGRLMGPVGFSRTVAIKRLHPHCAKDPDFVAMFLDEARLAARIQHPNVVPTLDIVVNDGELLLVMDYVQGETLSRLVRTVRDRHERIPTPIVASILLQTLHGLHAAHQAKDEQGNPLGIVHRDVSPQNVLVGTDGVARVLDFGVAKAAFRLQTTRDGQLKGKLSYMAPEQIGGHVDRLTDVYAVGVLLWEALTSRRLYEGVNEAQLLQRVLEAKIDRPGEFVEGLPAPFDEIAVRALQRDPAKRFQTAREMALALERGVAVASASEVGEWVEKTAHDQLSARAERVAEIESSAHGRATPSNDLVSQLRTSRDAARRDQAAKEEPTAILNEVPPVPEPTPAKPTTPGRCRILVIDDSEIMLGRIRGALEADNHEVVTTTRAVGNARHIPKSDLCIIDYHMPGIDGATVIQSLLSAARSGNHMCLFYLYTSDPQVAVGYEKLGFDGVLTDKGDEAALVRQVRAIFRMLQMRAMQKRSKKT